MRIRLPGLVKGEVYASEQNDVMASHRGYRSGSVRGRCYGRKAVDILHGMTNED